jgi:hypothetical protein
VSGTAEGGGVEPQRLIRGTTQPAATFNIAGELSMRRPIRIALKAVAIYAAESLTVAIVMAEMTLHPWRRPLPDKDKQRIAHIYAQYSANLQPVIIHAADGAELHAWYSVSIHDNRNAVILLHGIGDNRLGVAGYGQMFLQQGYRILLPDSRAHGESGGPIATYGLRESDDVHRWVSWLYERGAQPVLMASENRWAPHLCWKAWRRSPGFVRLSQTLHSPLFEALPTIVRDASWELAGWAWSR